jgi:hypothetical protein
MRKLASVQIVKSLEPIEGADKIEKCTILGFQCVVKKGDFNVGDKVVYFEVDSVLPERPEFEFLRERKFRIRIIKLRKQVSEGLVMPMSIVPSGNYNEGDDLTEILKVSKHDPQAVAEQKMLDNLPKSKFNFIHKKMCRFSWYRKVFLRKEIKLDFPEFVSKTDEERLQNMPDVLQREKDSLFTVSEKLDGCSGTYFVKKVNSFFGLRSRYVFGVCSRNIYMKNYSDNVYWHIAKENNLEQKMVDHCKEKNLHYLIIQGEITGPKIQKNRYELDCLDFYVFNVQYGLETNSMYFRTTLAQHKIDEVCETLRLKHVPVLSYDYKLKDTVEEMVSYSKGRSTLNPKIEREGVVVRNYKKNISFKVLNPDFLLKYDE